MNFFGTVKYYEQDAPYIFSIEHICAMLLFLAICIVVPILCRKLSEKKVKRIIFWLWIVEIILEIAKIVISRIVEARPLWGSHTPIHISSWFMYITPFYLWGKGWVKQMALAFICTIGLFGGLANFFIPGTLYMYPLFSFFGFHTIFYHVIMVFVAMLLWCTKQYSPHWKDCFRAYVPTFIAAVICIIVDYTCKFDYMFFYKGIDTPLTILSGAMPQWAYCILLLLRYFLVICISLFVPILGIWVYKKIKAKKENKKATK